MVIKKNVARLIQFPVATYPKYRGLCARSRRNVSLRSVKHLTSAIPGDRVQVGRSNDPWRKDESVL